VTGLEQLQRFMLRAVTHPDGVERGCAAAADEGLLPDGASALADVIPGNDRLTPEEQLGIYAFAYVDRIVEVLAGQFSATTWLLDDGDAVLRAYLADVPSRTWTLDRVGDGLPDWLAQAAGAASRGIGEDAATMRAAADIARVELAMDAVWDEPFADPVAHEVLAAIPPEEWGDLRVQPIPALRLLALSHAVTPAMNAARDEVPAELPSEEAAWMCVYRGGGSRWRFPLDREQHALFAALASGATLGEALHTTAALEGVDLERLVGELGEWFRAWFGSGLFASVG